MFWSAVGIAAALLTMFGFVPQIIKMWRTKSAEDVSGLTLLQFSVGGSLWIAYGLHLRDFIIAGANIVSLSTLFITLVLYLKLRQ